MRTQGAMRPPAGQTDTALSLPVAGPCRGHPEQELPGAPHDERPDGAVSVEWERQRDQFSAAAAQSKTPDLGVLQALKGLGVLPKSKPWQA